PADPRERLPAPKATALGDAGAQPAHSGRREEAREAGSRARALERHGTQAPRHARGAGAEALAHPRRGSGPGGSPRHCGERLSSGSPRPRPRSAGRGRSAGGSAGLDRHVDRDRGLRLCVERRGEAARDLRRGRPTALERRAHALERRLHVARHALEAALHAHADLEQRREVLLERCLEGLPGLHVGSALSLHEDLSRTTLEVRADLGVAVRLALGAHLRRLHGPGATRLLELDAALTRAGPGAFALRLHRAARAAIALALPVAGRVHLPGAGAFAHPGALALRVLAVALAVAGALAGARDFALALAATARGASALTLGASLHGALAFALAGALTAQLPALALDLGFTGLHGGVALGGAIGHGVHRRRTRSEEHRLNSSHVKISYA